MSKKLDEIIAKFDWAEKEVIESFKEAYIAGRDETAEFAADKFPLAHDLIRKSMILAAKTEPSLQP